MAVVASGREAASTPLAAGAAVAGKEEEKEARKQSPQTLADPALLSPTHTPLIKESNTTAATGRDITPFRILEHFILAPTPTIKLPKPRRTLRRAAIKSKDANMTFGDEKREIFNLCLNGEIFLCASKGLVQITTAYLSCYAAHSNSFERCWRLSFRKKSFWKRAEDNFLCCCPASYCAKKE